jgi:hypothetical protein
MKLENSEIRFFEEKRSVKKVKEPGKEVKKKNSK